PVRTAVPKAGVRHPHKRITNLRRMSPAAQATRAPSRSARRQRPVSDTIAWVSPVRDVGGELHPQGGSTNLTAMNQRPLRILFAAPVWAPSRAFGGPVVAAGELVRRLVARGNDVDVVTTTITDLHSRPALRSSLGVVDGASVRYLSTPLRYRWMGITPTLPFALARLN